MKVGEPIDVADERERPSCQIFERPFADGVPVPRQLLARRHNGVGEEAHDVVFWHAMQPG
jgi:hypothetical protein